MITKAVIKSINAAGTRCKVEIPLFKSAASTTPVEATALVNIAPGIYNNLEVGDVVLIGFEENAMEKPIILGKLFRGGNVESTIRGGGGVFDTLKVNSKVNLPASTAFGFPATSKNEYKDFVTPKNIADYIKWLENFSKTNMIQLEDYFRCFKNWAQWQLKAENVEVDDGDLDNMLDQDIAEALKYQEEGKECKLCDTCTKNNIRRYLKLPLDKNYPNV